MQIIREIDGLRDYLDSMDCDPGCFADTGFLYGVFDLDDRVHKQAIEVFELFEEHEINIFANVISRMELVDVAFRKQVTIGAIKTLEEMSTESRHGRLFNLLKKIRDDDTAEKRNKKSFKVSERTLKNLRSYLNDSVPGGWKMFCERFTGEMLVNEWRIFEEDLGLQFIEILEGQTSEIIVQPLEWADMVQLMGSSGLRSSDAMIVNMFLKSSFPLLVTTDSDIVEAFSESDFEFESKAIFHL